VAVMQNHDCETTCASGKSNTFDFEGAR